MFAVTALALSAGCSFGFFSDLSDLEDQIFVEIAEQPSGTDSQLYPVALVWAGGNGNGVKTIAIGNELPTATAQVFAQTGELDAQRPNDLPMQEVTVAVGDPEQLQLLIAGTGGNPVTPRILTFDTGSGLNGSDGLEKNGSFPLSTAFEAPTAVAFGDTTFGQGIDLVAGSDAMILAMIPAYEGAGENAQIECPTDGPTDGLVIKDIDGNAGDEIIISRGGEIVVADGASFSADPCMVTTTPLLTPPTGSVFGNQLVFADVDGSGGDNDMIVSAEDQVLIYLNLTNPPDGAAPIEIDAPSGAVGFATQIGVGDFGGDRNIDIAVGAPGTTVDGVGGAGTVFIYSVDESGENTPIEVHAFEPSDQQGFGSSLAVVGGFGEADTQDMLSVGTSQAENVVFMYFRQNLPDNEDQRIR